MVAQEEELHQAMVDKVQGVLTVLEDVRPWSERPLSVSCRAVVASNSSEQASESSTLGSTTGVAMTPPLADRDFA